MTIELLPADQERAKIFKALSEVKRIEIIRYLFELPTIKIAGIASRDYITCTLKSDTRSEPSYNDWKYRHYTKYILFTNYRTHFDSLRVIRIILCY